MSKARNMVQTPHGARHEMLRRRDPFRDGWVYSRDGIGTEKEGADTATGEHIPELASAGGREAQ
jgi:hypothetical protein